jgi:hypothetical protein
MRISRLVFWTISIGAIIAATIFIEQAKDGKIGSKKDNYITIDEISF